MTETIQTLKEDIAILQEKLRKLEEIEKQPRMNLQQEGEYAVVSYHDKTYYRLENKTTFSWYIKKSVSVTHPAPTLVMVYDAETERLLEGLYYNYIQVKKEKEQKWDVVRESKKWCEENPEKSVEDYLKPHTPEQVADGLKEAFREAVKQGIVSSVDKPKPMNEVLDRLENKYENDVSENKQKPKTLYDILYRWWMDIFCNPIYRDWDMETSIEDLVDRIEFWNMRIKNDDEVELDEQENDKNFKNSLDLIREWGEKNKPPTLTELLWEWWDCNDIFTSNSDLDADTCIDYLVNIIGKKFIPPSSDRNGYEWEKCLKMMRDKLR
jgi:hypothetical protein